MNRRAFLKSTGVISLSLALSDISLAANKTGADKPFQISPDKGQSDYPSMCKAHDGSVWSVWQNYIEGNEFDTIQVARLKNNSWSNHMDIPGIKGDIYKPACAVDKAGDLVVIWSEQNNGDWDLWQINYNGKWSEKKKLFNRKGHDFAQKLITKPDGDLAMAWQGFGDDSFDIFFAEQRNGKWSAPQKISGLGNDWFPDICVDNKGSITVAWDSYRLGNYDIYLRQFKNNKWQEEVLVSSNEYFEANVSIAADNNDGVWIAYEQRGKLWGKDFGNLYDYEKNKAEKLAKPEGSRLLGPNTVHIRYYKDNKVYSAPSPSDAFDDDKLVEKGYGEHTRSLLVDDTGLLWI